PPWAVGKKGGGRRKWAAEKFEAPPVQSTERVIKSARPDRRPKSRACAPQRRDLGAGAAGPRLTARAKRAWPATSLATPSGWWPWWPSFVWPSVASVAMRGQHRRGQARTISGH